MKPILLTSLFGNVWRTVRRICILMLGCKGLNQFSPKLTWRCSFLGSSFDLQPRSADGECTDYVAVFRKQLKKEAGVVPEARICGSALPDSMQIEESSMTVQFVSDSITGFYSGFSLHYETNFKESKLLWSCLVVLSWNC